jgi:pimeloyl-ACP methyl ester carboxylesterase
MSRNLAISARALSWVLCLSSPVLAAGVSEEVVSFTTQDNLPIQCILSYPNQAPGPFPGMLLIPGSGLHDADVSLDVPTLEITQGPQFLFRSMARYFSRQGWAVQRCNKRGASFDHKEDRPAVLENATLDDLTEDARLALAALHGHSRVLASPLVVVGHSEGSLVATRLAESSPDIDLLVLMGTVARRMDALIEYQLVERNLSFLRQAADANGDGNLTLVELNLLDGNFGLGSVYIFNCAEILFSFKQAEGGKTVIEGFNTQTDANGNGRLHIAREIEPALRREASRFLEMAADGYLGRYWQSLVVTEAPASQIHRVDTRILFVHGALDVQTPVDEPLAMMARLESKGQTNYDVLIFPTLGHSLSPPNDFYRRDGGLTSLDNLTLNAPRAKTRRLLLAKIEANLPR